MYVAITNVKAKSPQHLFLIYAIAKATIGIIKAANKHGITQFSLFNFKSKIKSIGNINPTNIPGANNQLSLRSVSLSNPFIK